MTLSSIKRVILTTLSFILIQSMFVAAVQAQGTYGIQAEYQVSNKFLVVGDRVDVTLKATLKDNKPMTQDRKARFTIKNSKPGQKCETTDDTFKDDAVIKGWCEAKGDAGNMEIAVSVDDQSSFTVDGTTYSPYIYQTYNAMFNDPKDSCKDANQAPSSVVITKQNDVTVDVKWQSYEKFVGYYEVMYGTTPGEYPWKQKTEQKSVVIDSLDSSKDYYFKVKAESACKTTTYSGVFKYTPKTGGVAAASEKVGSPSPSASPTASKSASPTPKASPKASVSPAASTKPVSSPSPGPEEEEEEKASPSPAVETKKSEEKKSFPTEILLIAGGVLVPLIGVGGVTYWMMRKNPRV